MDTGISPYVTECVFFGYLSPSDVRSQLAKLIYLFNGLDELPPEEGGDLIRPKSFAAGSFIDPWQMPNGGVKVDIIFALVHWNSVQTHLDAKETPTFKERVVPVRQDNVATPWKLRHVRFRAPDATI